MYQVVVAVVGILASLIWTLVAVRWQIAEAKTLVLMLGEALEGSRKSINYYYRSIGSAYEEIR